MKSIALILIALSFGCAQDILPGVAAYPPPNCIFPKNDAPVVCWVELPKGESVLVYSGDARLLCEDEGPSRWLVIDRKSNEKIQVVGGRCVTLVRPK